jgi:hypothetical protein
LGQQLVQTGLDSVRLRIFDQAYDGVIFYEDPELRAFFRNSIGCPTQITINTFESHSDFNPPMTITGLGPVLNIGAPTTAQIGQTITTQFTLNSTNSNIVPVIQSSPDAIFYDVDGLTNPAGPPASNFVLDSSRIQLDIEVELPLDGRAVGFAKRDTTEFIVTDPTDSAGIIELGGMNIRVDEIEFVDLRLAIDNGFPAEGKVQLYFTDSNYVLLDSVFAGTLPYLFEAGQVDANGIVTSRTMAVTDIRITQDRIENLQAMGSSHILIDGKLAETNNMGTVRVKVLNSYDTQIFLGVRIKVKANLEF